MTPDQFINLFQTDFVPLIIKLFILLLIFLYGIFAAVVLRQIQIMNKVVTEVGFSPLLFTVALFHFGAVVAIFILAILLI